MRKHPACCSVLLARFPVLVALVCLGSARRAQAFLVSGLDNELFVTGTAQVEENDNIYLSHSGDRADTIGDIVPGLEYDFGKNSVNSGHISASEDFQFFARDPGLNTQLPNFDFTDLFDNTKTKITADALYQRQDQATRDIRGVNSLILRNYYHADFIGEEALTDKTSVSLGGIYDDTDYLRAGYENWEWFNVPAKFYFEVEPKLDLSAGFSYQNNVVASPGVDSNEYFYNVGARGQFTGKLTGQFSVGYEEIDFTHGGKSDGVGADSGFSYAATDKTTLTLKVESGFGYSPLLGAAYRDQQVIGGFTSALNDHWQLSGQASYGYFQYISTTERDNNYAGQIGLTYVMNQYLSVTASYTYMENDSNIVLNSFTDDIGTLAVKLKF